MTNGSPDPQEEDEEEFDERRSEEKDVSTPNGQTTPSIVASGGGKAKKKNAFGTLRKKIRIPNIRSQELFDDETVSVTSSANRSQYVNQTSVAGSVVGSGQSII